jgi:hypothetical protein
LGSIAQTILKEKDPQQKDMLRRAYRETEKIIKTVFALSK